MASGHENRATNLGRTHGCTDPAANVKKTLANGEPSTHGTSETNWLGEFRSAIRVTPDTALPNGHVAVPH